MDDQSLSQQPYLTFFDEDTAEYDVIVDQSSSAPNLKEATWGALQPLLPLVAERMGQDEFGLVLEYSPLPESFLEKYKAIQEQKAQQPPPPDPEMEKIKMQEKAKQSEMQMKQQEGQVQMQLDQQNAQAQLQIERAKTEAQIQLEREKAAAQVMLEQEKLKAQMVMDKQRTRHDLAIKASESRFNMQQSAQPGAEDGEDGPEMPDMEDMDLFGNKALADSMAQMSQAIIQMAQANADSQRMMAEGVAALGSELKDAMSRPKKLVRGPDGRAMGIE